MKPRFEVAQIFRRHSNKLAQIAQNSWQTRTLQAIASCRTMDLGGHIDKCSNPECGKVKISYNSCRNRHCPKCQGHKREEWIQARENELLNIPYFHLVFTLPHELNDVFLNNKKPLYALLFKTVWNTVRGFADNHKFLGANTGMIAILHTWGQNMMFHPHLHCIVPGGGIANNGQWKQSKSKGKFLFPVKAMSKVFRAKFVEGLRKQDIQVSDAIYKKLFAKKWVVYCKRPFFNASQVIEYLGRYTHKVAISNHRITDISNGKVSFSAKDYRHGGKKTSVSISQKEFIRRFALHILPKGFVRIRHYGILSSARKKVLLPKLKEQLGQVVLPEKSAQEKGHLICPGCKVGTLLTIYTFDKRGPPQVWRHRVTQTVVID